MNIKSIVSVTSLCLSMISGGTLCMLISMCSCVVHAVFSFRDLMLGLKISCPKNFLSCHKEVWYHVLIYVVNQVLSRWPSCVLKFMYIISIQVLSSCEFNNFIIVTSLPYCSQSSRLALFGWLKYMFGTMFFMHFKTTTGGAIIGAAIFLLYIIQ